MDVGVYSYPHGDSLLIDKIVNEFLSQGRFDKLRKECMSDADTKPAYQNLQQRVENTVTQFLKKQVWRPDLNKNQLRDSLRKHILESKFFDAGINRIVDQVVNPNLLATVFLPEVEEVVYNYLSIPRPSDRNQKKGSSDERFRSSSRECEYKTLQTHERLEKSGMERSEGGDQRRENHLEDEDSKLNEMMNRKLSKDELFNEHIKMEPEDRGEERIKFEPEEQLVETHLQVEKMEIPSDESQESLNRMTVEGLHINEPETVSAPPDSDDSVPLEINEKSMSESRDSEDSIMNQMSPISQGRLTPDLEEEFTEEKAGGEVEEKAQPKVEQKVEEKVEEKKPLTFIGRIPKIKREDSEASKSSKAKEDGSKKEKLDVKVVYSSDESDSSKSYGKSDSDEKRRKSEKGSKGERRRDDSEKRDRDRKEEKLKDRHKDRRRERSRDRHKKSSSSSSSSQRERSSSHHKSSHRHKESKSKRKEEEKKKSKSTDDHGKERMKKEDRRSTDRDSNERERDKSSGSRSQGESRKREKEQQKTDEGKGESSQKEGEEIEQERDLFPVAEEMVNEGEHEGRASAETDGAVAPRESSNTAGLDFNELLQSGALSRLEFAKLTDDFYVKFNSTGFRYFEEWEKTKLDCEEEFKEFVDEAENDLSLLSDDESEFEFENSFSEENSKTIGDLLKGVGNFPRSLMFDPDTSEFYRWTNSEFFEKFRKKTDKRGRRRTGKKESVEAIKENIDRGEKTRALHLKLLNKYRRKAMRMGRPRRRHRRPGGWGIKEQNENRRVSRKRFFNGTNKTESFFSSRMPVLPDCNLVESENSSVPENINSVNMFDNEAVTLPDSPEENEDWVETHKSDSGRKSDASDRRGTNLPKSLPLHLPPSPDSDDINNGITPKHMTVFRKRINKETEEVRTPKKQTRRNYSQKYDNQDLYKPRPILNSSRTRGKERGLEPDAVRIGSPISR